MAKEIHCRVWYCDARGGSWQNGGVAQYIKGQWDNGEYNLLQPLGVEFHIMGTGFTWETQNRQADIDAAKEVWSESKRMLADKRYDLVVLDELTYMLAYHYLDTGKSDRFSAKPPGTTKCHCHRTRLPQSDIKNGRYGQRNPPRQTCF